jgi:hypothetical protein
MSIKIDSLDVMKAQEELDLQDSTRRDDTFIKISKMIKDLEDLDVFPSLVWLFSWDIIAEWYKNEQWADVHNDGFVDECFPEGLELKTIWDKFWEDSDKNGFSLEYGVENLDEALRDWLRECDFLVALDNDIDSDVEEEVDEDE